MKIIKFFLLLIFLTFLSGLLVYQIKINKDLKVDYTILRIKEGTSASKIASNLSKKKIIRSEFFFKLYLKTNRIENNLMAGYYSFEGLLDIKDVAGKILNGKRKLEKITFPEGLTKNETFHIIKKSGFLENDSLALNNLSEDFKKELTRGYSGNIEGFLYPETYLFDKSTDPKKILKKLSSEFWKNVDSLGKKETEKLSFYQVLTLASIVEGEAIYKSEMKKIAAVYLNRLRINQRLQADPTVAYILKQDKKSVNRILYSHLKIKSPYNTYLNYGLPPTPINNPSIDAIKAVLNPEKHNYFYFFAGNDGKHIFSKTYRQHVNRLNKFRRK